MKRAQALGVLAGCLLALQATDTRAQQPPSTQWTPEQIAEAVETVRAGRKLTPREWPNGARVAVCLSFDVDNETLSLNRGNTAPVTLSAGEFGAMSGLPRVLDKLVQYMKSKPGVWFATAEQIANYIKQVDEAP